MEEEFKKLADQIKITNKVFSNDDLLYLYGYYKQATEGNCNIMRPFVFNVKGCAKYDAWYSHKDVSKNTAMKMYINKVKKLL